MDHWPGYAQLMVARTTNGSDGAVPWAGGRAVVGVFGTFDGATVQISYSPNRGTTFIDSSGASFTVADSATVDFPASQVKATITNAGAGTSLSVELRAVGGDE